MFGEERRASQGGEREPTSSPNDLYASWVVGKSTGLATRSASGTSASPASAGSGTTPSSPLSAGGGPSCGGPAAFVERFVGRPASMPQLVASPPRSGGAAEHAVARLKAAQRAGSLEFWPAAPGF